LLQVIDRVDKIKTQKTRLSLINYSHRNNMKLKLIRLFFLGVFCLLSIYVSSQELELDEYRAEIGISGGGAYYLGDANSVVFNSTQLSYGAYFRYRFNPRIALKAEFGSTKIKGTFNEFNNLTEIVENPVKSFDLTGEFNFFDLEKNEYKQYSKIFSPYIFAGVGIMSYNGMNQKDSTNISAQKLTLSIPFGLGMKVKLGNRWNLNVQWTTRLLLADNLENIAELNNKNNLNGSNPFNNDFLSTLTVGIGFDIWKKHCDCLNSSGIKNSH